MKMKMSHFFTSAAAFEIWLQRYFHENIYFFLNFLLKNSMLKLYLYLPSDFRHIRSRKNSGASDGFSLNKLANNDTSGNRGSVVYCLLPYNF